MNYMNVPMMAGMPMPMRPRHKSSNTGIVILVVIFIFCLLIGGGVAFYFNNNQTSAGTKSDAVFTSPSTTSTSSTTPMPTTSTSSTTPMPTTPIPTEDKPPEIPVNCTGTWNNDVCEKGKRKKNFVKTTDPKNGGTCEELSQTPKYEYDSTCPQPVDSYDFNSMKPKIKDVLVRSLWNSSDIDTVLSNVDEKNSVWLNDGVAIWMVYCWPEDNLTKKLFVDTYWNTHNGWFAYPTNMPPGGQLFSENIDHRMQSNSGKYYLIMQKDGNLVLYKKNNIKPSIDSDTALWSTGTYGKGTPPYNFSYQKDGNLVVYDKNNQALWASFWGGNGLKPSNKLILQDDGNLVLYDNSTPVWSTQPITSNYKSPIWKQYGGDLKQIQIDGNVVCGVNYQDNIFCKDSLEGSNWFQIPGGLKHVSVSNGKLYGVNSQNQIFYADNYKSPSWKQIDGGLKQVDMDGNVVCGVNDQDNIFCKDNLDGSNWFPLPGGLKYISVSNGKLYGVNSQNDIFYADNYRSPSWKQIYGKKLKQVEIDGNVVCGVDDQDNIFCKDDLDSSNWFPLPRVQGGGLKHVSINNQKIYGVNSQNQIFSS